MICLFTAAELACRLSFHPFPSHPSHYTRMSACGRQGRWERLTGDRRHPGYLGFHDEYQVMQMHSIDSTLGQWVRQWTSQPEL